MRQNLTTWRIISFSMPEIVIVFGEPEEVLAGGKNPIPIQIPLQFLWDK
jgi:hypothetical protein